MGCTEHKTSSYESYINCFFNSLPVRNMPVNQVNTELIKIKSKKKSDIDAITTIQKKLFKSEIPEFASIELYRLFYIEKSEEYNIKYFFWFVLLFCSNKRESAVKFKEATLNLLELFGHTREDFTKNDFYFGTNLIKELLTIYTEFVSMFALIKLSDTAQNPRKFFNYLEPCFNDNARKEFINNFLKQNPKVINFTHFTYILEELKNSNLRYNLVENHVSKQSKMKLEQEEEFDGKAQRDSKENDLLGKEQNKIENNELKRNDEPETAKEAKD